MQTQRDASPPPSDLEHVLEHTADVWAAFKGRRLFLTGGTGFFGTWLLESCLHANRRLGLGLQVVALTRDKPRALGILPHLADRPELSLIQGDVKTFRPPDGAFDFALHVATETRPSFMAPPPAALITENLLGTSRFLELVRDRGVGRFLFTSSGAVYGPQPPEVAKVAETDRLGPDPMRVASAYGEAKRASELLCAAAAGPDCAATVARCFAFVGPRLPLGANYAIGNFIREAASQATIKISGDGSPLRSYLYAADLAAWLWTILLRGRSGEAYNVGSERPYSIKEIAECVRAQIAPQSSIAIARAPEAGARASRYIPDTAKARGELALDEWVDLPTAIRQTAAWYAAA